MWCVCFSDCAVKQTALEGRDDVVAMRLWEDSARLVGYTEKNWTLTQATQGTAKTLADTPGLEPESQSSHPLL